MGRTELKRGFEQEAAEVTKRGNYERHEDGERGAGNLER
jgi:hypothetical protein